MTDSERFDPFNNRQCRDVRNALSVAFIAALVQQDLRPVQHAADDFAADRLPETVRAYIDKRLAAYATVTASLRRQPAADPLAVAFRIWDSGLFFETHEYLEEFWMGADGERKKLLQAVIRAAGTYVHLEQGNIKGAARIAAKAIEGLEPRQDQLSRYIDAKLLLEKLRSLDPEPPTLSGTATPHE